MSALELRIAAYAGLALILLGGSGWIGHRITATHYDSLIAADKAAQSVALQDAQRAVIAAQQAQQQATQQAETQYATLKSNYDGLSQRLADSVRSYSALRGLIVPASTTATSKPDGASPGTGGDSELATLSGQAAASCYHDAAELTALQTWARALVKQLAPSSAPSDIF